MMKLEKKDMQGIAPLFKHLTDTVILSCLQGYMGQAWADQRDQPTCAQIIVGDFCFFAGDSSCSQARVLVENIPKECGDSLYMISGDEGWENLVEQTYGNRCRRFERYGFYKGNEKFDVQQLQGYIDRLSPIYEIVPIDSKIYALVKENVWSKDFCAQFSSYEEFKQLGLGFCVLHNNVVVCGASSYSVYDEGIEIEIATKEGDRQQGLATACAAQLILTCLSQGKYPSWDAANKTSVALATKLGYRFDKAYTTYEVYR